jgi:hypothetical protein
VRRPARCNIDPFIRERRMITNACTQVAGVPLRDVRRPPNCGSYRDEETPFGSQEAGKVSMEGERASPGRCAVEGRIRGS